MQFRNAMKRALSPEGTDDSSFARERIVRSFFSEAPTGPAKVLRFPSRAQHVCQSE
jgi:hypothetical protein